MNYSKICPPVLLLFLMAPAWAAQPIINSFSPQVGSPGDKVTVYGSGFNQVGVKLFFWQNITPSFNVLSDSQITATIPAGISTGPLAVQLGTGSIAYTTDDYLVIGRGPYISSVSPTFGATNDTGIIITGVHLTNSVGQPTVTFGGIAAPDRIATADGTQITVTVPYGAHSGPVAVTTTSGGPTNGPNFLVIGPGPYITGFTPANGTPGTVVNVSGRFLSGVTNVTFSGAAGGNLVAQPYSLQITAPANVATGPIAVFAPLGMNSTVSNFLVPPTFSAFAPTAGRAGTNVIISGTSFSNTYAITFNGLSCTDFTVLSNSAIRAAVPAGASDGLIRIFAPAGSAFSAGNFIVQPTVYGFTPNFGTPGVSSITITGANFNVGTPTVRFNGTASGSVSGVSFGQLTAAVPVGATTGPISVSTTDGGHTNVATFYVPASITSFTPTNSPPGTTVILTGQNFLDASAVAFNGTAARFTPPGNNTTLVCVVPTNFTTGPLSVTVPAGVATSSAVFYAAPIITSFAPSHGLPGASVTINGQSFLGTRAVRFNGLNAFIVSVNNTQIVATVPNLAQTGPITVEAPAGTNTTVTNFLLDYTSDVVVTGTAAPSPVTVGSNLVYTIVIANTGPWPAPNVTWTNQLPPSVDLVDVSVTSGTSTTNSGPITGNVGTLAVTGTATLTIKVTPRTPGTLVDLVSIGSDNPDPSPGNNNISIVTSAQPLALLSIRLMTNQVKLSWPSALTGYVLESRLDLGSASWASNAGTSSLAGSTRFVTEPATNGTKLYRLRK